MSDEDREESATGLESSSSARNPVASFLGSKDHSFWIVLMMLGLVLLGLGAIGLDCGQLWARGLILSGSFLAVGFLVGFLFGIPKVLQGDLEETAENKTSRYAYQQRVNTNLEDISDWLTKIIVGLGLYELRRIPSLIGRLADGVASGFQQPDQRRGIFAAAIVYFLVFGFLLGYLVTRLYLQNALGRADKSAMEDSQGNTRRKEQDPDLLIPENAKEAD